MGIRGIPIRTLSACLGLASLSGVVIAAKSGTVRAHDNECDSVDGSEQTYQESTKYDDSRTFAQGSWNSHGAVYINEDTVGTLTDLVWADEYVASNVWGRYRGCMPGSETIFMNDYNLQGAVQAQRRYVALHEEGHSLDFNHTSPPIAGDLMNAGEAGSFNNTITPHSHCDYHTRWGNPIAGHSTGCGK